MSRLGAYSLLTLVVVGSCAAEYLGVRVVDSLPARRQKCLAAVSLVVCGWALAAFRNEVVVTDCSVLLAALIAGTLLSRQIGSVGALATMLIVAAIADLISSYAGPSRWLVDWAQHAHGVTALQFLAVSLRMRQKLVPVIGVADLMFFTACVSVMRRLGWPELWTLIVPLGGLVSGLYTGLFVGFTPALPFLATAVLLYVCVSRLSRRTPSHG